MIGLITGDIARVFRIESQFAGLEIHPVDVEKLGIALVQLNQGSLRMGRLKRDDVGAHFLERSKVARLFGGDVSLIDAPVLIAILILGIEDVLRVELPKQISDAALAIVGDGAIVRFAQSAYPDIEHSLIGGKIGKHGAIRRNLW